MKETRRRVELTLAIGVHNQSLGALRIEGNLLSSQDDY